MRMFNLGNMTDEEKEDMFTFFERKLVSQAFRQHLENDENLRLKGLVVGYEIDRENERLLIRYENGELWEYRCVDCGADGMLYDKIEG